MSSALLNLPPEMLLSVCNTKLRDFYTSLVLMCDDLDISIDLLTQRLEASGFVYVSLTNQFKPTSTEEEEILRPTN